MLKVLIADDEPRVGQLVKHLIHWEELGLSFVDICRDGRTALERIEQEQPEVVITDIRMPVLTGLESPWRACTSPVICPAAFLPTTIPA